MNSEKLLVQGCLTEKQYKDRQRYKRWIEKNRDRKNQAHRRWLEKNREKKRSWNLLFRLRNPYYNREYRIKKHIDKYGVLPSIKKNISMFEQTWVDIIKMEFPNLNFEKVRPDWLKNPKTGRNLELDMYCEQYKLAIEISGDQHFYFIPKKFHKNIDDFINQVERDVFKAGRCREMGIRLIVITKRDKPLKILKKMHEYVDDYGEK